MEDELKSILADIFDVSANSIDADFEQSAIDMWDSLAHLRMITAVEESFGVTFSMQTIAELTSYPAIVSALSEQGVA